MKALTAVCGLCWGAVLLSSVNFAWAQEADTPAPIRKKSSADPYAAIGIDAGGLRLFPSIEIGTVYSSNVGRSATNANADFALELKPSLRFESDWSRHSWTGSATGDLLHYKTNDDLSTLTGGVETAYRLDIRRTTKADFAASYTLSETGTENSQVPATAIGPRRDHNYTTSAALTHDFGGLEGSAKTTLARSLYEDVALNGGGTENNSDRNYWAPTLSLRAALNDNGASFKPFAEVAYAPRLHDQTLDRNGINRNSQGLSLAAGLALNRGPIWDGEIALTYVVRDYADASLETAQGLGAIGRIKWSPTELTSVEATSGFSVDETSAAGISASRSWTTSLDLTHALRENLDAKAGLSFSVQDSGTGIDHSTTAKLGLDWKLNPNITAGVNYQGLWFSSGSTSGDYNDQRVMSSIVLKR